MKNFIIISCALVTAFNAIAMEQGKPTTITAAVQVSTTEAAKLLAIESDNSTMADAITNYWRNQHTAYQDLCYAAVTCIRAKQRATDHPHASAILQILLQQQTQLIGFAQEHLPGLRELLAEPKMTPAQRHATLYLQMQRNSEAEIGEGWLGSEARTDKELSPAAIPDSAAIANAEGSTLEAASIPRQIICSEWNDILKMSHQKEASSE